MRNVTLLFTLSLLCFSCNNNTIGSPNTSINENPDAIIPIGNWSFDGYQDGISTYLSVAEFEPLDDGFSFHVDGLYLYRFIFCATPPGSAEILEGTWERIDEDLFTVTYQMPSSEIVHIDTMEVILFEDDELQVIWIYQ